MKVPDLEVGKRLFCGKGDPSLSLGIGPTEIRGASFIEGPQLIGNPTTFPSLYATLMVAPLTNPDAKVKPTVPGALCSGVSNPYSLAVSGNAAIFNNLDVAVNIGAGNNIIAQGEVMSRCGTHILSAKKNFDIPHPIKDGWRLRHTCPEGPSNDVYFRGKLKGENKIYLPEYWKKLVDPDSITVNLTPIGSRQSLFVESIENNVITISGEETEFGTLPVHCFYHVFGERADGEKLIPEYEGNSPADYPGNNSEYSVSGYHYDVKE